MSKFKRQLIQDLDDLWRAVFGGDRRPPLEDHIGGYMPGTPETRRMEKRYGRGGIVAEISKLRERLEMREGNRCPSCGHWTAKDKPDESIVQPKPDMVLELPH